MTRYAYANGEVFTPKETTCRYKCEFCLGEVPDSGDCVALMFEQKEIKRLSVIKKHKGGE